LTTPTPSAPEIDWPAAEAEVTRHLQNLLRLETVNPPGNETIATTYLKEQLAEVGIAADLLEDVPGRANLLARWPGSGAARPLLLMGHVDVVPAEAAHWSHPPFAGEIAGGFLWGRGAVDMKNIVAIHLTIVRLLKRSGVTLPRDILIAFTADEEAGSDHGMEWVAEHHFDRVDAEYALSEGGGEEMLVGPNSVFPVQTGEKGVCRFRLVARGRPGHASLPHDENCIVHLGTALARLGGAKLPLHLTETLRGFFRTVAQGSNGHPLFDADALFDPTTHLAELERVPVEESMRRYLHAITHNTASPTILHPAGTRINVIPSEATAEVDCRIIPGLSEAEVVRELRAVVGEAAVIEVIKYRGGQESDYQTPLFDIISAVMAERAPGCRVVPILSSGGTDARSLVPRGVKVYGFCPLRAEPGEPPPTDLMHNHDERISRANLHFALRCLYDIVWKLMSDER
jgi:acetylornithine deacetylase/succinyl-diaminopimelate desuccinylase-like protein